MLTQALKRSCRLYSSVCSRCVRVPTKEPINAFRSTIRMPISIYNSMHVFCYNLKIHNYSLNCCRSFHVSSSLRDLVDVYGPLFAESINEGDIRWLKQKGDTVNADELVAEIETDKTAVEVISPQSGVIEELLVADGEKVTAKQLLFRLKPGAGKPADQAPCEKSGSVDSAQSVPIQEAKDKPVVVERVATQPPITMDSKPDTALISHHAEQPKHPRSSDSGQYETITGSRTVYRVKMNRMRMRIAQRLKDAQNTYAMLTTFNEVDMSAIVQLRKKHNEAFFKKHGVKLGFMSPFVKAAAYALQDQPIINAVIEDSEILYRQFVDISVAVASPKGLVVPVIRNVESMDFAAVEKSIAHYAELARSGKLAVEDMEGGTFTISNGGVFGSLMSMPIINPPQSAILGIHATVDRPVAIDGKVEIRPMMYICLTYDHRLIDGREAVLFLRNIKKVIEDPASMILGL